MKLLLLIFLFGTCTHTEVYIVQPNNSENLVYDVCVCRFFLLPSYHRVLDVHLTRRRIGIYLPYLYIWGTTYWAGSTKCYQYGWMDGRNVNLKTQGFHGSEMNTLIRTTTAYQSVTVLYFSYNMKKMKFKSKTWIFYNILFRIYFTISLRNDTFRLHIRLWNAYFVTSLMVWWSIAVRELFLHFSCLCRPKWKVEKWIHLFSYWTIQRL